MAEYARAYRVKNPESHRAALRKYQRTHPERFKESKRKWILRTQYGLTVEEYESMLEAQNGCCAICGEEIAGRDLNVDHCHQTETVRGILCSLCNRGIGHFKDDPERLISAAMYLLNASNMEEVSP